MIRHISCRIEPQTATRASWLKQIAICKRLSPSIEERVYLHYYLCKVYCSELQPV